MHMNFAYFDVSYDIPYDCDKILEVSMLADRHNRNIRRLHG